MSEVLTTRDGAVLTITLNRPDVFNAFNRGAARGTPLGPRGGCRPGRARGRDHGCGSRLLGGPGSARVLRAAGIAGRCARGDLPPEHQAHPRPRQAGHRRGQRAGRGSGALARERLRRPRRVERGGVRPRLRRHRPRARLRRHLVPPPPARVRARVRVDELEPQARCGRGARLGARLRGDPGRRASRRGWRRSRPPGRRCRRARSG